MSDVLQVTDLVKHFPVKSRGLFSRTIGQVQAVDGVSFSIGEGRTLGLVGESGCGKSTTGRTVLRLLEPTSGSVVLDGREITGLGKRDLMLLRRQAQMIFQDPYNALNPRHTVGTIISAPFRVQKVTPPGGVKAAVQELMARVGLNPEHYNRYPNEFSGGQRQRIGIARSIALRPRLIVCDEPVSALDVSVQAQIMNLLMDLQSEFGMAYLFISHELSVVRHISDDVAVMYLGEFVEFGSNSQIYTDPQHPYTQALLSAVPVPDPTKRGDRQQIVLQGDPPSPVDPPSGCRFRTRCWKAQDVCAEVRPPLADLGDGHRVACHFPAPLSAITGTVTVRGDNTMPLRQAADPDFAPSEGPFGPDPEGPDTVMSER